MDSDWSRILKNLGLSLREVIVVLLVFGFLVVGALHLHNRKVPSTIPMLLKQATAQQPRVDTDLLLRQAFVLLKQHELDAALDKVNSVILASPENPSAYGLRGSIYTGKKLWDLAENDYLKVLQFDHTNVPAIFDLAEIQFRLKQYDKARPGFFALVHDANTGDVAAYRVFLCDLFGGHEDVAVKELDAFNQVGFNASYYFGNAAWCLFHHKTEAAQDWLVSAGNIYPSYKFKLYAASLLNIGYMAIPPTSLTP